MVKLEACGLDNGSHNLFLYYLSFKKQGTKFGSTYSTWSKSRCGIPEGSIYFCNFADDNTLYSCGERLTEIKENLIFDTKSILNWFRLNSNHFSDFVQFKFRFHLFHDFWGKSHHKDMLKINSVKVQASVDVLLLGTTIDKNSSFKQHIENLCRKVQYKLHALRHIRKFLTTEKAKIVGNALTVSLTAHHYYEFL